jgi:hypothetical protein
MFLIQMNCCGGPTFDGLDSTPINITADIESTNYIATDAQNQYSTTGQNMDLVAAASTPIFAFKNSSGVIAGDLQAAKVTLTQPSTLTTSTGGLTIQNSDTTPGLVVQKSAGTSMGSAATITSSSATSAPLALTNNSTSSNTSLQILAPNLTSGNKTSIQLGRDISNTGNSYSIGTVYNTTSANQRLEINSFGEATPALQIYKQATSSTSATTGSVVTPGDLTATTKVSSKALTLYSSSSGSATLNVPSTIATPYTLTLPNTLGTNGQILTLGTPSGSTATTSWNDPPVVSFSGAVGRQASGGNQSIPNNSLTTVLFASSDGGTNIGTVPISYTSGTFTNTASYTTSFTVLYFVKLLASGTSTGFRQIFIMKNASNSTRFGFNQFGGSIHNTDNYTVCGAGLVTMAPNDTFTISIYQNSGAAISLDSSSNEASRVQITQVQGTVPSTGGIQTIALTTPSSLFSISGSPTSGNNPTISITTASTPTGTGGIVLQNSPTLTGSAVADQLFANTLFGVVRSTDVLAVKFLEETLTITTTTFGAYVLNNTSNTNIIIAGSLGPFTIQLPNATTLDKGIIYKFNMTGSASVFINRNDGIPFYTIIPGQTVYFYLEQNATTNGVWEINSLLSSNMISTNSTFQITAGCRLKMQNSTSNGIITMYPASSQSSDYDFILPTTVGTSGQVLTSSGSGSAMTWSTPLTTASVLNLTSTGNTITNANGTLLTLTTSSGSNAPLSVQCTTLTNCTLADFLVPNLTSGYTAGITIGKAYASPYNYSTIGYAYYGDNNVQNCLKVTIGLSTNTTETYLPNKLANDTNGSFRVKGGIVCDSFGFQNANVYWAPSGTLYLDGTDSSIQTSYGGNVFGNSGFSPSAQTEPIVTIYGKQTAFTNTGVLAIEADCLASSTNALTILNPNLQSSSTIRTFLGKSMTTNNAMLTEFNFSSSGSTSNFVEQAMYNGSYSTRTYKDSIAATSSNATFKVNGGLAASSIFATQYITTPGALTAGPITTTSPITFNLGSGQYRQFKFDYGEATPTFWWGYNTSDKTCTYNYPDIFSLIANRQYYWQQVGFQYSFWLQMKVEITFCPQSLPIVFINDCNPPEPACGAYTMGEPPVEQVINPFGIYVPAMYLNN